MRLDPYMLADLRLLAKYWQSNLVQEGKFGNKYKEIA